LHTLTETLSAGLLLVQSGHDWGGGPPWADGDDGTFWGPWVLVPFLFWVGFGAFVVWIVSRLFPRRDGGGSEPAGRRDPAEEILRERFARGEIPPDEYRRSLRVLRGETPHDLGTPEDGQETT
jgi:putative membrane protein